MSYKGLSDSYKDWQKRKSNNKNQLFKDLKPRDRIGKLIIEKNIANWTIEELIIECHSK
ncbi:hypothetical protein [Psychroserpens algicola]|uniref:Uncharacterized protein n=1 Tax=Psychroserpens algicola TaxID=1719034 RepID=A0ABT0HBG9_9FLAO|nr:hypothetical protein [Psychroserpens algicola]MCK8481697.1 hypothetical protein [Psychroserpens algicola]